MDLTQIRAGLAAHGAPRIGHRYAQALRDAIADHTCQRRGTGLSWAKIAAELGIREVTLQRWAEEPRRTIALVPVVAAPSPLTLRIRTASGAVLEGLDLDTAVRVLRALG
jgi:hypothetical protein